MNPRAADCNLYPGEVVCGHHHGSSLAFNGYELPQFNSRQLDRTFPINVNCTEQINRNHLEVQLGIVENKCYFTTWWCRWLWNSSSKKMKCHEIHRAQVESASEEVLLAFCRLYSCLYFRLVKEWIGDDDRLPFSNSLKQDIFRLIESWESRSPPRRWRA